MVAGAHQILDIAQRGWYPMACVNLSKAGERNCEMASVLLKIPYTPAVCSELTEEENTQITEIIKEQQKPKIEIASTFPNFAPPILWSFSPPRI